LDDVAAAGGAPTRAVWGSLLVAAGRAGLTDVCRRLWADMEAAGVAPGLDGWHARLQAAAYSLAADDAVDALNGMTAADVAPTSLSYNLALKAHAPPPGRGAAAGRLKTGLGLLDAMRSAGVAPDVATFTSLIGLAAGAATVDANFRMAKENRCRDWLWGLCGYSAEFGVPDGVPYAGFDEVMEALFDFGARAAAGDGDFDDLDDTVEYIYWRLSGAIDPQNKPF
jgi:pentatricopeptide repeat protein